ncbi:MAG TPA: shikimate kinase [Oscillospiraceae bacterium]|nr:shikimate kinase [Oscillospiraceae bacterium]HPS34053.1 shikimate kinase [Oscillospiraceae bacterium]
MRKIPNGIIVFGANGSGKSTIGRELARVLNYKFMDHEDYHFEKSEIPYTVERTREECLRLMLADIDEYGSFVLCTVTGDFCEEISSIYDFAVYLSAPHDIQWNASSNALLNDTETALQRAATCMSGKRHSWISHQSVL